jgi:hypothetical protein
MTKIFYSFLELFGFTYFSFHLKEKFIEELLKLYNLELSFSKTISCLMHIFLYSHKNYRYIRVLHIENNYIERITVIETPKSIYIFYLY